MTNPVFTESRIVALRNAVESPIMATGHFGEVMSAEPISAAGLDGLTLALWVNSMTVVPGRGMASASARVELFARSYHGAFVEYRDNIDPRQLAAAAEVFGVFIGGFTVQGFVCKVDIKGEYGNPLGAVSGHLTLDRKIFRIYDVIIPLIVDDLWVEAP